MIGPSVQAVLARLPHPRMAQLEKGLTKRLAKLDRRVKRLDKKLESRVGKAVRKELRAGKPEQGAGSRASGTASAYLSQLLDDPAFSELYEEMAADWFKDEAIKEDRTGKIRWRVWLAVRFARHCEALEGSFAEFGTYRAGVAFMVLGLTNVKRIYLFDTFTGIPADRLTEGEQKADFAGKLDDTSPEYVEQRLSRWAGRFEVCAGDVFETLPRTETGPLAFVHMDLNAAAPTRLALEYAYPRLVAGGVIVFDDYGFFLYRDQQTVIDEFFADQPDEVIGLPTGQGLLVKKGSTPPKMDAPELRYLGT